MRFVKDREDPHSGATLVSTDRQSSLLVHGFDDEELKCLAVLEEVAGIELAVANRTPINSGKPQRGAYERQIPERPC